MTGPRPTCTRTEQAVGWALHALEPDEEIAVERHVPTCPDCSAAVRDAQVVMAQLATAVEQVEPPARLRASILDAAAATPQVRPQAAAQPPPSPGPRQPRTSRPTGPAGPAPGGPRPPGSQPAGRSRRLSPGRLVTAAVAALAIVAAGGLGIRTVQLQQQTVQLQQQLDTASSQVSSTTALVQDLSRPGSSHALLAKPDGTAVAAVVLAGEPAHRLHDRPRRQLRRPDLRAVGPQGRRGRPRAARGVRRGSSATPPRKPSALPRRSRSARTRSPLEPGRTPPAVPTDVVASGALTA